MTNYTVVAIDEYQLANLSNLIDSFRAFPNALNPLSILRCEREHFLYLILCHELGKEPPTFLLFNESAIDVANRLRIPLDIIGTRVTSENEITDLITEL